jgi:alcohol dehydrogenase
VFARRREGAGRASHRASFAGTVLSVKMPFPLPVPYTPGPSCIGIVEEVAPDVVGIRPGQRVFCAAGYTTEIHGGSREEILIGWFGFSPSYGPLLERWKNGAFAEKAVYPASCLTLVGDGAPEKLVRLGPLSIAYGGLIRGELRPGQTLLINGATGNLGSAALSVALGMGASRVYAVGRNPDALEKLRAPSPNRVVPIPLRGDEGEHAGQLASQVQPVDVVLDVLGHVMSPAPTMAALGRLRPGGTAVFMGGVRVELPVSHPMTLASRITIRGSFMHPPTAPFELWRMVQGELIDLDRMKTVVAPLAQINDAIHKARELRGLSVSSVTP